MTKRNHDDTGDSYDAVVDEYVRHIFRELEHKPFDRELLDRFASGIRNGGTVADIGCGPGQVGRYLHERGVRICGLDLSARMVESARRLNPEIEFMHGDMQALPVPDGAWAGIVAFYSIIHFDDEQLLQAFREMARVLRPWGVGRPSSQVLRLALKGRRRLVPRPHLRRRRKLSYER